MEGRWNVGEVCVKPVPQPFLHGSAHSRRMQLLLPPEVHCSTTLETSRGHFVGLCSKCAAATLINILLPILASFVDNCACVLLAKNGNFDKHIIANFGNFC